MALAYKFTTHEMDRALPSVLRTTTMAEKFNHSDLAGLIADYVFLLGGLHSVSSYRLVNKLFEREGMRMSGS